MTPIATQQAEVGTTTYYYGKIPGDTWGVLHRPGGVFLFQRLHMEAGSLILVSEQQPSERCLNQEFLLQDSIIANS